MANSSQPEPFPLLAWCLAIATIVGAFLLAKSIYVRTNETNATEACFGNLEQIGVSAYMYAADYDNRYMDATHWVDLLEPYVPDGRESCLHDPGATGGYGYAFNKRMDRTAGDKIQDPVSLIMVFDSADLTRNAAGTSEVFPNPGRHDNHKG